MFTIILITIIAIILIIFFWHLTQRLHGINHHLEKISQGDLTKTLSSNNTSIFKQFSSNINIFILKIRRFITETATLNDKLIDYCRNLSKDAEDVQIAANKTADEVLFDMDYKSATKILKEKIVEYPYFDLFALMQKDGLRKAITLDYTENEVYVNFSHRPYFKEAITGDNFKSEPYIYVDTNNYCIAISVPVRNGRNEIIGILMGDLILG